MHYQEVFFMFKINTFSDDMPVLQNLLKVNIVPLSSQWVVNVTHHSPLITWLHISIGKRLGIHSI